MSLELACRAFADLTPAKLAVAGWSGDPELDRRAGLNPSVGLCAD